MHNDLEQLCIEFHNRARPVFFTAYQDFKDKIEFIDRKNYEHSYQEKRDWFLAQIRHRLESIAKDILYQNRMQTNVNTLNQVFPHMIAEYLADFIQRINEL